MSHNVNQSEIDKATPPPNYSSPQVVYTYYGFAAWWAQLVELRIIDLISAIRLAEGEEINDVSYRAAFKNLERQTLGMLLRKCREAEWVAIPEDDERVLAQALEKRNYLIHRFFSVHDEELLDYDQTLVNELREVSALLASAHRMAEGLYLAVLGAVDDDGTMAERIMRLGTAWDNVVTHDQ